jgi:hypothetical protein
MASPYTRADAAHRTDRPERAGARADLGEQQRREDVDGRDQQRRTDPFQDRVADDEHALHGRVQVLADVLDQR